MRRKEDKIGRTERVYVSKARVYSCSIPQIRLKKKRGCLGCEERPIPFSRRRCTWRENRTKRSANEEKQQRWLASAEPLDLHRSHFLCHMKSQRQRPVTRGRAPGMIAAMAFWRRRFYCKHETDTETQIETGWVDASSSDSIYQGFENNNTWKLKENLVENYQKENRLW